LIRPLLLDVSTGRKSLNQVISGSGLPLAAQSMVAVRERSTTFSWGPMSMVGNPEGSWSSTERSSAPVKQREHVIKRLQMTQYIKACDVTVCVDAGTLNALAPSVGFQSTMHRGRLMLPRWKLQFVKIIQSDMNFFFKDMTLDKYRRISIDDVS